jgi:hypothetical protein
MPPLTLNQAAKAARKSKSAILEAIRNGRLSASRDDKNRWQIEPVELFRVYPQNQPETSSENQFQPQQENRPTSSETASLLRELENLKTERERERAQFQETIADLRKRLDDESSERRRLTALITHQPAESPSSKLHGLFGSLFGSK